MNRTLHQSLEMAREAAITQEEKVSSVAFLPRLTRLIPYPLCTLHPCDACGDSIGLCMLPTSVNAETEIDLSSSRKTIYTGDVVSLGIEEVLLPGGRHMALEVVRHPGGAAVVAIDDAERVCLLRQYRHASGGWLWELPAGKIDPCEGPEETALRELQEEAGLRADDWHKLGVTITTPGFCDERIHLFLARELTSIPSDHHADEIIEIHWLPFDQALAWIQSGEVCDAKTLIGLFLAERFIRETKP